MLNILEKHRSWLLPTFLILFILEIITLPFMLGFAYAGRSENPDHVLTYDERKLVWDSATGINEKGVAELSLFKTSYNNVESKNEEKLIAPGTTETAIVRLKNNENREVKYTAVVYEIKSNEALPVDTSLIDSTFADTENYSLSVDAEDATVIRAVTGVVGNGQIQDFDISWVWEYSEGDAQDLEDTILGDEAKDDITVGIYIVVEDEGERVKPQTPQTGDNKMLTGYLTLMAISVVVLLLLVISKRQNEKE